MDCMPNLGMLAGGVIRMKIIIDCSDFNDWYLQEILLAINTKVGYSRVKVVDE